MYFFNLKIIIADIIETKTVKIFLINFRMTEELTVQKLR